MAQANTRSEQVRILAQLFAAGLMLACTTTERTFNEQTSPAIGGSTAATGGASMGGVQSSANSNSVGGTKMNGGASAVGGASTAGGQSSAGNSSVGGATATVSTSASGGASVVGGASAVGTSTVGGQSSAGNSSVGGTNANGGALASGGAPTAGGASASGGSSVGGTNSTGGALASGGAAVVGGAATQGGSQTTADTSLGGTAATGGAVATGGASPTGGAVATGGAVSTGGTTSTCTPTPENCTDGIDNDCNGNIDCPIISGRFPEPGRAAAGDDAWVQLNAPTLAIQAVQCRTGKPSQIASKPWTGCTSSAPTSLTVYSMGAADAQLADNNGVTQFDFRFLYTNGVVSDPASIVYYAHNSLWDNVAGTPALACPPLATDAAYFSAASTYLTGATSQPTFAASDVQLKNPFIALKFTPSRIGMSPNNVFTPTSTPQPISVLSLRHRFLLDPNRQMLLVTRSYKSRRENAATCRAAIIEVRDTHTGGVNNPKAFKNNHCDAIVLNQAGSGVCIEVVAGTPTIRGIHSTTINSLLVSLGIPWPSVDMTMWQKLFDDRPQRHTLQIFSDKCRVEDTACLTAHPFALSLPDSGDAYFTSP